MPSPVDPDRPSSRQRLVAAADELMYARGYEAVGVAELCRTADVRRGTFYFHFPSKQALAVAMLEESWQRTRESLFEPTFANPALSAPEAVSRYSELLRQHLDAQLAHHGAVAGCRFGNFAVELAARDETIRARVVDVFDEMVAMVGEAIERDIEQGRQPPHTHARDTAVAIIAHMEGVLVLAKAHRDPSLVDTLVAVTAKVLA